jgi:nitrite reductase/ring-hydroxylating ferredoxin subunit
MPFIKLCDFIELSEIDSRGFVISEFTPARNIFIVRNKNILVAYENSCPHNFAPLNWSADVFLSYDQDYIQCSNHGALFEIEDGRCIYGPCSGQSLKTVAVKIDAGVVYADL